MNKTDKEKIVKLIDEAKTIGLVTHLRMDPDGFGCILGLQESLVEKGKKVIIFSEEKLISFMRYVDPKCNYHPLEEYEKVDLIFMCDTATPARISAPKVIEEIKKLPGIVIDHHASKYEVNPNYIYFVERRPSASELCYEFLKEIGYPISKKAAGYFYTGLMSDTGDFTYASVNKKTLEIADEILKNSESDIRERNLKAVEKDSAEKEEFYKECLKNVIFSKSYQAVLVPIKREQVLKHNFDDSIGSQVASYIEEHYDDKASFVFSELKYKNKIKVSMRSNKTGLNVRKIAEKFGGGGHDPAAGFETTMSLDEIVHLFK